MKRSEQILGVMASAPARSWSAAEISVHLNCDPARVRCVLYTLVQKGLVTRPRDGAYLLPTQPEAAPAPERPAPIRASSLRRPAAPPEAPEVRVRRRETLLTLLRAQGRPVSRTTIVVWLRAPLAEVEAALADLCAAGQVRECPGHLWEAA